MSHEQSEVAEASNVGALTATSDAVYVREVAQVEIMKEEISHV